MTRISKKEKNKVLSVKNIIFLFFDKNKNIRTPSPNKIALYLEKEGEVQKIQQIIPKEIFIYV